MTHQTSKNFVCCMNDLILNSDIKTSSLENICCILGICQVLNQFNFWILCQKSGPQHIAPGLSLDCSLFRKETPKGLAVLLFLILSSINHQDSQCYAMGIWQKSKPVQFMYFYVKTGHEHISLGSQLNYDSFQKEIP